MNVPTIGGARGIFEIFVPGIFFLLNLGIVVYLTPFIDQETKDILFQGAMNPILALIVAVSFGYLVGVLLRLFRTDLPDRWSQKWLCWFHRYARRARKKSGKYPLWATEKFPYIGWIGKVSKRYLPDGAQEFYNTVWLPRKKKRGNKQFFNYCKVLISSCDEKATAEIYAAESLTRYIAGMFRALSIIILLMLCLVGYGIFSGEISSVLVTLLIVYLLALILILRYFRFIRIKEVEVVFAASYANREIFVEEESNNKDKLVSTQSE